MTTTTMKHSGQRDAIRKYLMSTKEHPSAEMVYRNVRKVYPKISLGTVYRNLTLLVDLGEAKKVTTVNGEDRFDGTVTPHYHLICKDCNAVVDLKLLPQESLNLEAGRSFGGEIHDHEVLFYGLCEKCAGKAVRKA